MWAVKFLSGPKAGEEFPLQDGLIVLGKDPSCQIPLPSPGVSKKHAQITVSAGKARIEDLNSSNGTYIDGKQIHSRELREGDRVSLCDVIFEVRKKQDISQMAWNSNGIAHGAPGPMTASDPSPAPPVNMEEKLSKAQKGFKAYLHNAVLPGVYKLAEWMEFKWVVGIFVIGFIFLVTFFSSFPFIQILKSSVEKESFNSAESIALTLTKLNRESLHKGLQTALSVSYAKRRPGVKKALIVSAVSGRILAPAELAHNYPKLPFIHKARKLDQITVEKIDSSTVGAMAPIRFYNPKTGESAPTAYAVVIYNMTAMTKGNSKAFSLMAQNLFIACALGLIIFFFLINLIEFPVKSVNRQLNQSLKDDKTPPVSVNYRSPVLQELCDNINNGLNRIALSQMEDKEELSADPGDSARQNEMKNLIEVIGFPALSVDLQNDTVAAVNTGWTEQIGMEEILQSPVQDISDGALKAELEGLIQKSRSNPHEISFGEVYLKETQLQITCQIVMGSREPAYAVISFMPAEKETA